MIVELKCMRNLLSLKDKLARLVINYLRKCLWTRYKKRGWNSVNPRRFKWRTMWSIKHLIVSWYDL